MDTPTDFTWLPSDERAYTYALNAVPPAAWEGSVFLNGEAYDSDDSGRNRYRVFRREPTTREYQVGSRPITVTEFRAL